MILCLQIPFIIFTLGGFHILYQLKMFCYIIISFLYRLYVDLLYILLPVYALYLFSSVCHAYIKVVSTQPSLKQPDHVVG